jgi:hypothetical protein
MQKDEKDPLQQVFLFVLCDIVEFHLSESWLSGLAWLFR